MQWGVTLNPLKCEFAKQTMKFLGHVVSADDISADSVCHSCHATSNMCVRVTSFHGDGKSDGQILPKHGRTEPAIERTTELIKPTVLAVYNPEGNSKLSADASSFGLGAVLQEVESSWKPVAFGSRALSETEKRYAQTEKEALALTWACKRFSTYLLGWKFTTETDHKSLVPLLSSKHLDDLPPRILQLQLQMARYDYSIHHIPGKLLYTADALSRVSTSSATTELEVEVEAYVDAVVVTLPATEQQLQEYRDAQKQDEICFLVMQSEWPRK